MGKGYGLLTQLCAQTGNVPKFRLQHKCGMDVGIGGISTAKLSEVVVPMESSAPATTQFVESNGGFGVDVKIV